MKNLLLEQRGPSGLLKTWKLTAVSGRTTFGSSKHAGLRSMDSSVQGMQGYFELVGEHWTYFSLEMDSKNDQSIEHRITERTELKIGATVLSITPFGDREAVLGSLDSFHTQKTAETPLAYQIFAVSSGADLLETKLLRLEKTALPKFISGFDETRTAIQSEITADWKVVDIGVLRIQQKTIYLPATQSMTSGHGLGLQPAEKVPLYATLVGAALLSLLFMLSPNSKNAGETAMNQLPPAEYRQMKLAPPKKKVVAEATQKTRAPAAVEPTPSAPASKGNSASSTLSAIKSLSTGSRLSHLLGKISAGSTRSKNLVITQGLVAGSAPSGRALASLGEGKQKDWGAEGTGGNIKVSTLGTAGGHGVGGMGGLAAGKTGTGGAELLEDESEIVGGLDRDIIAQYIRSQLGQILYCYERQLSASPDLFGKVAIRFTIGSKGDVETQRIGDSTLRNATVEGCILQKVAKWRFPAPDGGTKVNVTYPFLFKSTN